MNDTTIGPTSAWEIQASDCIKTLWAEQAFQRSSGREEGLERLLQRHCDFRHRAQGVAAVITDAVPLLNTSGQLSSDEYETHLQDPLYRHLPFLEAHVREELARNLVSAYVKLQSGAGEKHANAKPMGGKQTARRGHRKESAPDPSEFNSAA